MKKKTVFEHATSMGSYATDMRAYLPRALEGSQAARDARLDAAWVIGPTRLAGHLHDVSLDFVEAWAEKVAKVGVHSYADYSLLRGALESMYLTLWLLHPTERVDRVDRMLTIFFWELGKRELFAVAAAKATHRSSWPVDHSKEHEAIDSFLAEIGKSRADYSKAEINFSKIAKSIASKLDGSQTLDALEAWAVCSAFSHGQYLTGNSLSKKTAITDDDGNGFFLSEAADTSLLPVLSTMAIALTAASIEVDRYGIKRYGKPQSD